LWEKATLFVGMDLLCNKFAGDRRYKLGRKRGRWRETKGSGKAAG